MPELRRVRIYRNRGDTMTKQLTLSCPICGTEHGGKSNPQDEIGEVEKTNKNPDGIVRVSCGCCGEEFDVGYQRVK